MFDNIFEELSIVKVLSTVKEVENLSDELFTRMRILFHNGLGLSIIRGFYSYGGREGLYEISPCNSHGDMDGSYFDDGDSGDDVCGWCDVKKVLYYVDKIGNADV